MSSTDDLQSANKVGMGSGGSAPMGDHAVPAPGELGIKEKRSWKTWQLVCAMGVAALVGVTLLSESFTPGMGVGFILVLVGSVLATRRNAAPDPKSLLATER